MKNILITIKKELRTIIRDKKSLFMMALSPLFIPTFVILMGYIYDVMLEKDAATYKVGINYYLSDTEEGIFKQSNLEAIYYSDISLLEEAYDDGKVSSYIIKDMDKYTIYGNSQSEDGAYVRNFIIGYLESYNSYLGRMYLIENNIDSNLVYNNISYEVVDLPGNSIMASQIVNMAIVFTIMGITLTAIYTATDLTAGEKERGTLETLLTYPIKSSELIIGKYLAIVISTILTLVISIILSTISLLFVKENFMVFENAVLNINVIVIVLTFVILFTYSLFISGLCIAIASFAKSFKEAQSTLTPVSLLICVPMFLQILGISLNGYFTFIPIFNHSLILNDIFAGNINILNIFIVIISSIIYATALVWIIVHEYKSESILFNTN